MPKSGSSTRPQVSSARLRLPCPCDGLSQASIQSCQKNPADARSYLCPGIDESWVGHGWTGFSGARRTSSPYPTATRPLVSVELVDQGLEALGKLLFEHVCIELPEKVPDDHGRVIGRRGLGIESRSSSRCSSFTGTFNSIVCCLPCFWSINSCR